jgi:hypothetical protein
MKGLVVKRRVLSTRSFPETDRKKGARRAKNEKGLSVLSGIGHGTGDDEFAELAACSERPSAMIFAHSMLYFDYTMFP